MNIHPSFLSCIPQICDFFFFFLHFKEIKKITYNIISDTVDDWKCAEVDTSSFINLGR